MITDFDSFVLGAALNLAVVAVIVRFIYYPLTPSRSYVFTFLAFSPTIYFVISVLTSVELSVGVGFGLFAIFSVLRYRTEEMQIRDMSYLFIIIALPIVNSFLASGESFERAIFINLTLLVVLFVLEREWGFRFEGQKRLTYDRIDLIRPAAHDELLADLRLRTGLPVTRAEVGAIDLLRETARVTIFYDADFREKDAVRRAGLDTEYQPAGRQIFDQ